MSTQTVKSVKRFNAPLSISILEEVISKNVREAIHSEFMKISISGISDISPKEQADIERLYKKPSRTVAKTFHLEI